MPKPDVVGAASLPRIGSKTRALARGGHQLLASQLAGHHRVDIAPNPGLARLDRSNQRVLGAVKVFGRVLVLRGIAAANVSTLQAQAQMDPGISDFYAVFTNVFVRAGELDLIEMRAMHEILHRMCLRTSIVDDGQGVRGFTPIER